MNGNEDPCDQNKVEIAVRFLKNSNVRNTDKERKVKFLQSKGLSNAEIEQALVRASEESECVAPSEDERWYVTDYLKAFIAGVGILSAANYAYKAYILPYIAHEMKDDRRIENLTESLQCLQDDLKQHTYELNGILKHIKAVMEEQQTLLANLSKNAQGGSVHSSTLDEFKTELATLKSMMLSKTQFPPAPFSTQVSGEIPAWQRMSETVNLTDVGKEIEE